MVPQWVSLWRDPVTSWFFPWGTPNISVLVSGHLSSLALHSLQRKPSLPACDMSSHIQGSGGNSLHTRYRILCNSCTSGPLHPCFLFFFREQTSHLCNSRKVRKGVWLCFAISPRLWTLSSYLPLSFPAGRRQGHSRRASHFLFPSTPLLYTIEQENVVIIYPSCRKLKYGYETAGLSLCASGGAGRSVEWDSHMVQQCFWCAWTH